MLYQNDVVLDKKKLLTWKITKLKILEPQIHSLKATWKN